MLGRYEGSHVLIFDSFDKPSALVLAWNPKMRHTTTPGFGQRRKYEFDDAARLYVKKQTGLEVPKLYLISEWDNGGQPFDERVGIRQYVSVKSYVARRTIPEDVEAALAAHRETGDGMIYQPRLVPIDEISTVPDLSEELPSAVHKYLERFL